MKPGVLTALFLILIGVALGQIPTSTIAWIGESISDPAVASLVMALLHGGLGLGCLVLIALGIYRLVRAGSAKK